eukprot:1168430_1
MASKKDIQEMLVSMTFQPTYIQRAFKVYEFTLFESHMTMEDAMKLSVHDKIDHRDLVGRFVFATVSEKQGSKLKIHYHGWSRKWDTWSDFSVELHRFAVSSSIS